MTPNHHPTEELLGAYAGGALGAGAALVVRAHLCACSRCRSEVRFFESVGAALLEAEPAEPLAGDALARALASIERPGPTPSGSVGGSAGPATARPRALDGVSVGGRRWLGPGAWLSPVELDARSPERAYLLRVGAGMAVPRHGHTGREFTCVLEGSYSDAEGAYGEGDFVAADESVEHKPVVGADAACVCLISTEGPLLMRGLVGRLLQSYARV